MSVNVAIRQHGTDMVGAEELSVSETVDAADLRRMLESLVQGDHVHSWRNFGLEGTLDELLQWENTRRPTRLFFFHLRRSGELRMVAAGAVADRVSRDFPHHGFPVLGRCCIMPEFRSHGFYRHVLRYRLEHCRAHFGSALNAVHIGAVNERISRVITDHRLPGWPRFIHLGDEELRVEGELRTVGAYLMLLPEYVRRLLRALEGVGAPQSVVELREAFSRLESSPVRNFGTLVREMFDRAREAGWFDGRDGRDARELEQLLAFCRAVPLVGFS